MGIAPYTIECFHHVMKNDVSGNVHADFLLVPYQQYWQLDRLVADICCKDSSDACHTVLILDVVYGSVKQPAHNPTTIQTCHSQSHFLPYMTSSESDAITHHIITTSTEARGL